MSQKQKDKNIEKGSEQEVPVASRMTYYAPRLAERDNEALESVTSEVYHENEKSSEAHANASIRPSLQASATLQTSSSEGDILFSSPIDASENVLPRSLVHSVDDKTRDKLLGTTKELAEEKVLVPAALDFQELVQTTQTQVLTQEAKTAIKEIPKDTELSLGLPTTSATEVVDVALPMIEDANVGVAQENVVENALEDTQKGAPSSHSFGLLSASKFTKQIKPVTNTLEKKPKEIESSVVRPSLSMQADLQKNTQENDHTIKEKALEKQILKGNTAPLKMDANIEVAQTMAKNRVKKDASDTSSASLAKKSFKSDATKGQSLGVQKDPEEMKELESSFATSDATLLAGLANDILLTKDVVNISSTEKQNAVESDPSSVSQNILQIASKGNTPALAQEGESKKSGFTSVLDRLGDESSAINIFGDGTSLPASTQSEEETVFSSAFKEEENTEVVKVGRLQKSKSKKNLSTADLAALPYFQEDKDFMSKVDEAWYDQGQKSSKTLVLVFSGLLCFFIAWASFASVDEVSRGQGTVIPSQRMQLLQHLEGGILSEILVSEGDQVEPDQILARVDSVSAASSLRDIESQMVEVNLALIRLEAERADLEPIFPEHYQIIAPDIVAAQEQTYISRHLQQESNYGILEQQIEQKHQELNESLSRKKTYEDAHALVQKRVDIARPLVSKKLYPEVDFLNLQQELVRLAGDISAVENSIAKINAEIREAEGRLSLSKKEFTSEVIKEINTLRSELATLEQSKTAGTDRVTRTELRAQVRGVVNRILLNTKGGVVKPGESIMEIVPLDDTLVIETKVRPQDIAFIHPAQKAIVRITAYDASIYGTMDGVVEQIGADTVTDEQGEVFFLIKVRTEKNAIEHNGEVLPIMPGMIAAVDILTGKKTILSYLMKPLTKASQYALKER